MKKKKLLLLLLCMISSLGIRSVWGQDVYDIAPTLTKTNVFYTTAWTLPVSWASYNTSKANLKDVTLLGEYKDMETGVEISTTKRKGLKFESASWLQMTNVRNVSKLILYDSNGNGIKITVTSEKGDNSVNTDNTGVVSAAVPINKIELPLDATDVYTIKLEKGAKEGQLVALALISGTSGPTEDTTPPSLISSVPTDKELDIALELQNIELIFDEAIALDASGLTLSGDAQLGSVVVETQKVTIPVSNLNYSTNYTLTIPAGSVTDRAEIPNATTEDIVLNFTTKAKPATFYLIKSPLTTWNFAWSEETLSNLTTDLTTWTASSSTRFSNNLSMSTVTADGIAVAELDGLLFKKGTADVGKDVIRIDYPAGNHTLTLNASTVSIIIPNRKAGEHIVVTACANGSAGRTITPSNAIRIKGAEGLPVVMTQSEFVVLADGDVALTQSGGLKWASIEVQNVVTTTQLPDFKELNLGGYWGKTELESLPATITSVNLKDAETDASAVRMANPNCLIYSSKTLTGTKNVIINGEAEEIILIDGVEFNCPEAFNAQKITYTRSFPVAGVASLCLPFAVNALPSGVTAERYIGSEGATVHFESVTALEDNTPYIATVEAQDNIVFEGAGEVVATKMVDVAGSSNDYTFKGMFENIVKGAATGLYTLRADGTGFGRATENATVVPFRAYIQENGSKPNPVKLLTIGSNEGGATMIADGMTDENLKVYFADGKIKVKVSVSQILKIYTISGQLVSSEYLIPGEHTIDNLAKGIYLIENNKIVVR